MNEIKPSIRKIMHLYNSSHKSNSLNGTVEIMTLNCNATFQPTLHRICMKANTTKNKITSKIISAYAQTLEKTLNKPKSFRINYYPS